MARSLESMTLREKFTEAEKLTRELADHLEKGFLPQIKESRRLVLSNDPVEQVTISDLTIRNSVAKVLQSDKFSQELCSRLASFLNSIQKEVNRICTGN